MKGQIKKIYYANNHKSRVATVISRQNILKHNEIPKNKFNQGGENTPPVKL